MSGQDGNRGYLIQTVIALLESLRRSDWDTVTLEPDHESEKIDIKWSGSTSSAQQVKSSINQINLPDAKRWAEELEAQAEADQLVLVLIGPCSQAVARLKEHGRVEVPCPKNLDFDALLGYASHLLDRFLVEHGIIAGNPGHRELMVKALVAELAILAGSGQPLTRSELVHRLTDWIAAVAAPSDLPWEVVEFSSQRGIEHAIAGKRLGPSDVEHCPEFPICDQVAAELERSNWYSIVGSAGCGKSVTAWQAAKKLLDRGHSVWRPKFDADPSSLLSQFPSAGPVLLVIDDAQQFGQAFVERLCERASVEIKMLFTSTLADPLVRNPACIAPADGVAALETYVLSRRDEILPIVQRFDDRVSDRYMAISFERRVSDCAKQKTPWEFFWVLRGGWQTATQEFESLKQVPGAVALLTTIAIRQIASCDAGLRHDELAKTFEADTQQPRELLDPALEHCVSLGLILIAGGYLRTKHISFGSSIIEIALRSENKPIWEQTLLAVNNAALDPKTSLEGVSWLLGAVSMSDAMRFDRERLAPLRQPLMRRCRDEWEDTEWAAGCMSRIYGFYEVPLAELTDDEEMLLSSFVAGAGLAARFGCGFANHLINRSDKGNDPATEGVAKAVFEKVDWESLLAHANTLELRDYYTFGDLLNRLAFYSPEWSSAFIDGLDWPRLLAIILKIDSEHAYAVDKLVGSLTLLASPDREKLDLRFVEDIVPYIAKAVAEVPMRTIEDMQDVFWQSLGYAPKSLRNRAPDPEQRGLAARIVGQLSPSDFGEAMGRVISRELETLARSLAIVHEIEPTFCERIEEHISLADFYAATATDWQEQSDALRNFLRFFCSGQDLQPARQWTTDNSEQIEGPLHPLLAGMAPEVAVQFFNDGKDVCLVPKYQRRLSELNFAICAIATIDEGVCLEVIEQKFESLESYFYTLVMDEPNHVIRFFRILHQLSEDLYERLLCQLDPENGQMQKTLTQLVRSQPNQQRNYRQLARLAMRSGGSIAEFGKRLLSRIDEECERQAATDAEA